MSNSTKEDRELQSVDAQLDNNISLSYFVVAPEILGKKHKFEYNSYKITIAVPTVDIESLFTSKPFMEKDGISIMSYKNLNNKKIPVSLDVDFIYLAVDVKDELVIPSLLLESINMTKVSKPKTGVLNKLIKSHQTVAEKAFNYWLRVLRWKSGKGTIGRPSTNYFHNNIQSRLSEKKSKTVFWSNVMFTAEMSPNPITIKQWSNAAEALESSEDSPIFINALFDAIEHKRIGDYQRSIVDLAVSCEVFIRTKVAESLPSNLQSPIRDHIDDINIRTVMTKFYPNTLSKKQLTSFKKNSSKLHKIFEFRNQVLHSGKIEDSSNIDETKIQLFIDTTKKLVGY